MNYMCRLCLSNEGIMEPIFNDHNTVLLNRIFDLTSIMLKDVDGWPTAVCEDCKSKLIISISFKKLCINTQNSILEQLGVDGTDDENEEDDDNVLLCEVEVIKDESDVIIEIFDSSDDDDERIDSVLAADDVSDAYSDEDYILNATSRTSSRVQTNSQINYFEDYSSEEQTITKSPPKRIRERRCSVKIINYCEDDADNNNTNSSSKFECNICHFNFNSDFFLNEHKLVHINRRPHKCDICSASFKYKSALRQHKVSHTEKKYQCNRCLRKFRYLRNLTHHEIRVNC